MKKRHITLGIIILLLALRTGQAIGQEKTSTNVFTDKSVRDFLDDAHNVMMEQEKGLRNILSGFLQGNLNEVAREADRIVTNVGKINQEFPPPRGEEAAQWQAVTAVLTDADTLRSAAEGGNFKLAYKNFTSLTNQCMKCHNARRDWGRFEEPEDLSQTIFEGSIEKSKKPSQIIDEITITPKRTSEAVSVESMIIDAGDST